MEVMIVNGQRFLISTESPDCDKTCKTIIEGFEGNPIVEFDRVRKIDL